MWNAIKQKLRERAMLRFYRTVIRPGDLCFDIGANVGKHIAVFRACGARVIAVEPQKKCAELLYTKFSGDPNVVVIEKAVGEKAGTGTLSVPPEKDAIATLSSAWQTQGRFVSRFAHAITENVEITTLDALIALYGVPHFCKIDVEGFEENALRGLSSPIPLVSFEFAIEFLDNAVRCASLLESLGNRRFNYCVQERLQWRMPEWNSKEAIIEHIKTHAEPLLWGDIYAS